MQSAIDGFSQSVESAESGGACEIGSTDAQQQPSVLATAIVLPPSPVSPCSQVQMFGQMLENILESAVESVIVDLLWVEAMDATGVAVLVSAAEKASNLGKTLSFQSMNHEIRSAVEMEWDQRRQQRFGTWSDCFDTQLEQFLGRGRTRKGLA